MALTITRPEPNSDSVFGNKRIKVRDVEFDSSYPTGGESLTADDVDLAHIDIVVGDGVAGNSDGTASTLAVVVRYDYTNETLQAFQGLDPADAGGQDEEFVEVADTVSLTDFHVRLMFIGH